MLEKCLIFLLMVVGSNFALAYQSKSAKNYETLHFDISRSEYSRIFVAGDRINSIKGQTSFYEIKEFKNENEEGVIFLRPTNYAENNFSIFISTEGGRHYTLRLNVKDSTAESIEIKPLSRNHSRSFVWEKNTPYTQIIINLLRQMVNNSQSENYSIIDFDDTKPVYVSHGLCMQLIKVYQGSALSGEVWVLSNPTPQTLHLIPSNFFKKNVSGISLATENLKPNERTILYRIVCHEPN